LYEQFGQDQTTGVIDVEAGRAAFEDLDITLQRLSVDQEALVRALLGDISDEEAGVEAISDDEVRATYDEAVEQLTRRCISIVQADPADGDLDDQAARAQEIYEALEAGEPFASVVEEESEGSAQPLGGEVGCL